MTTSALAAAGTLRNAPLVAPRPARIAPLDGLRAVAVLGVLYAHIWSFSLGRPTLVVARVDLNRALSLFGTGVDLFFVISGFCMYLMYGSRQQAFEWPAYKRLLVNRFWRIAPAFYVAAIVSAGFVAARGHPFPSGDLLAHLTFTFQLLPGYGKLAASFWSLGTEWHFYLLLPFVVHLAHRFGFWRALGVSPPAATGTKIIAITGDQGTTR